MLGKLRHQLLKKQFKNLQKEVCILHFEFCIHATVVRVQIFWKLGKIHTSNEFSRGLPVVRYVRMVKKTGRTKETKISKKLRSVASKIPFFIMFSGVGSS